ncbi:MAG: endoribonuclease MazF [Armatimonadetes bacterium]|nr:endoribonuclease MazF [Armatimonadota bacterium]
MPAIPERGDLIWLDFSPHAGHEQAGRRPGLVLSPSAYNKKVGLMLVCPVTSRSKGFPFEVPLPAEGSVTGFVLSDHIRSADWRQRRDETVGRVPDYVLEQVVQRVEALLRPDL